MKLKEATDQNLLQIDADMPYIEKLCKEFINASMSMNQARATEYKGLIISHLMNDNWNRNYIRNFMSELMNVRSNADLYKILANYHILD